MKNKKIIVIIALAILIIGFIYVIVGSIIIKDKMNEYLKNNSIEQSEIKEIKVKHSFMNIFLSYNEWIIKVVYLDEPDVTYMYAYKSKKIVYTGIAGGDENKEKSEYKHNNGTGSTETDYLFSLKNEYIGNAAANNKIIQALDISSLGNYMLELETTKKPYALKINFTDYNVDMEALNLKMKRNAIILLSLISNADEIHWNVEDVETKLTIDDINKEYGNIKDYGKSSDSLHSLLILVGYYN